jgi:hypothetical protein
MGLCAASASVTDRLPRPGTTGVPFPLVQQRRRQGERYGRAPVASRRCGLVVGDACGVRGRRRGTGHRAVHRRSLGGRSGPADRTAAAAQDAGGGHRARRWAGRSGVARGRSAGVRDHQPAGQGAAAALRHRRQQGRPVRRLRARRRAPHRPATTDAIDPRRPGHDRPTDAGSGPQGPGRRSDRRSQPAAQPSAERVSRGGRAIRRAGQPDQPDLPGSFPFRTARPLALGQAAGCLADLGRLLRAAQCH